MTGDPTAGDPTAGEPPGPPGAPGAAPGTDPAATVVQEVSSPLASSLPSFVDPAGQAVHTLDLTYSFAAHRLASQRVSAPLASSPAVLVVFVRTVVLFPAELTATRPHLTHMLEETYSLTAHNVAAQMVSAPFTSAGALVVPAGQAVHTFDFT